jgi:PKD repeat protein
MKRIFTLGLILFITISSFAQISLSSADMPVAPWTQRIAKETLPLPAINFGSKGANQVYDFSNLTPSLTDTIMYKVLTSAQQSAFPGADDAVTSDNVSYLYTKTTSTVFDVRGIEGQFVSGGAVIQAPFSTPSDIFHFPTTYGTNFSGTSALSKTVPGCDVGQCSVNQVRLTTNATYTDTADGWGKVITPVGAYKCLRKKRKETTTTLTEYKLFAFSSWTTLSNTTTTTVRYTYPTKEAKGSVVNFEYDSVNNVTSVSWSLIPPAAPVANFGSTNGGGGLVSFTDSTDGYPTTYSWTFGDGGTSSSINPNHTYGANGAYNVCLTVTNAGGSNTFCDSVHITGITAANHAPIAVTDTISLLQATSITIFHVGNNDIDPDNDNLCMDTVWGSPYVTEYIGGSCDMVSIHPDSAFVGTDTAWYRICDNGSPVLCDTGLIIFTVTANPALLPVASFTSSPGLFTCPGSVDAHTNYQVINTSTQYDSTYWTIKVTSQGACKDSTTDFWGDTLNLNPSQLATHWNCSQFTSLEVCMFVSNRFGWDAKCDTICNIVWLGISEVSLSSISLFPNPASNILTIDMRWNNDEISGNYTAIEIYNTLGEKVKSISRKDQLKLVSIPVAGLSEGMYVATLVDAKGLRRTLGRFTKE